MLRRACKSGTGIAGFGRGTECVCESRRSFSCLCRTDGTFGGLYRAWSAECAPLRDTNRLRTYSLQPGFAEFCDEVHTGVTYFLISPNFLQAKPFKYFDISTNGFFASNRIINEENYVRTTFSDFDLFDLLEIDFYWLLSKTLSVVPLSVVATLSVVGFSVEQYQATW